VQAAFLVSATFAVRNPLGSTTGSTSTPIKRLLPMAAAPAAMAGIAAAFAFGNGPAAPAAGPTGTHPAATTAVTPKARAAAAAQLMTITRRPTTGVPVVRLDASQLAAVQPKGKHHRAMPATYTVESGDTLASIAQRLYVSADYWTVLYWANEDTVTDASAIQVGQVLKVPAKPAKVPAAPKTLSAPATTTSSASSTTSTVSTTQVASVQKGSTGSGTTSFQECVIAAESGGNAQIMNSSGHYGLYQFSYSTWVEYGGDPAEFGHATVAEQNQVFENAMATPGGEDNWAPYDGC
jgi:LysM repeat protein